MKINYLKLVFSFLLIAIFSAIYFVFVNEKSAQAAPLLDRTAIVMGIDNNSNGIRDEIDVYINGLSDSYLQKKSLEQVALAFSAVLSTDLANITTLRISSEKLSNSSSCIFSRYPGSMANKRSREMEKFYFNTKQRLDLYDAYNQALSGSTSLSPVGNACTT